MTSKIIRTIVLSLGLICCVLIPLTSLDNYNSLSEYANSNNQLVYIGMFLFTSIFFFLNGYAQKRKFDYIIAIGMLGILFVEFDSYRIAHNIITAITLILCLINIIYFSTPKTRIVNIVLSTSVATVFLLGFIVEEVHFALTEIIAMYIISINMFKRIWS